MSEKKAPKVSFIIIYTNDDQIRECIKWIDAQTYDGEIEKIIINNKGNKNYSSAAKALNEGAQKSTGDVLFFMHQDVYLWDVEAIKKSIDFLLSNNKKNIIIGAAGIGYKEGQAYFNIFMDEDRLQHAWRIKEPLKALTLDECLIITKKELWEKIRFDEITCEDWHFYGADVCYVNSENDGENYILPLEIMHSSRGTPYGKAFKQSAINLAKKHHGKISRIKTTIIDTKCSVGWVRFWFFKRELKEIIKKVLKVLGLWSAVKSINDKRKKKKGIFVE